MPYALPALSESEQALMIRRVEQGSTYTPRVALGEDFRERIERWEAFLNEDSLEDFLATELQGIDLPASEGTNPCKFGMVGATGAHTSSTTAEEDNFFSKSTSVEPSATRVGHPFVKSALGAFEGDTLLASGYQGIWATENTRAALFDAMDREETYATTGSRMIVRFFGGWEFNDDDLRSRQPAFVGYEIGVASLLCSTKLK